VFIEVEKIHAYFKVLSQYFPGGNEESLSQDNGYLLCTSHIGYRFCQSTQGKNFRLKKDDDDGDDERQ
jgi:hypothetical protein